MNTTNTYNIIFAGTPDFAAIALQALITSPHTIKAVYTQPDRPAGRGRQITASPVKTLALEHQLPVYQPATLRDEHEQKILASLNADLVVVAAYGLLLPLTVLQTPKLGCINIHASLLPRWRGAAPIQRAILAGDKQTGITIMQMAEGLDTGDMLYKQRCDIEAHETSESLHDKLATLGADALLKSLANFSTLTPEKQDNSHTTYAHKITKDEAELDWSQTAEELDRKIRAFYSWPVAFTLCKNTTVRIWQAEPISRTTSSDPGTIIHTSTQGIEVATGHGVLQLQKIQLPGGKVLPVADILNARSTDFTVGNMLG